MRVSHVTEQVEAIIISEQRTEYRVEQRTIKYYVDYYVLSEMSGWAAGLFHGSRVAG